MAKAKAKHKLHTYVNKHIKVIKKMLTKRILVISSDGIIFNTKENESTFDNLLRKLGRGDEARKLQKLYIEGRIKGPLLLKDKVALFKNIYKNKIEKVCSDYIKENLNNYFIEFVSKAKKLGYITVIVSSNPSIVFKVLTKRCKIDYIFATELEFKKRKATGYYVPLKFDKKILTQLKKEFPELAHYITTEPNRYGLAIKIYEMIKKKNIDHKNSVLIAKKLTRVPIAKMIGNTILFGKAEKQLETYASHKVSGKTLKEIMQYL